jgi:hypothetical protein
LTNDFIYLKKFVHNVLYLCPYLIKSELCPSTGRELNKSMPEVLDLISRTERQLGIK